MSLGFLCSVSAISFFSKRDSSSRLYIQLGMSALLLYTDAHSRVSNFSLNFMTRIVQIQSHIEFQRFHSFDCIGNVEQFGKR